MGKSNKDYYTEFIDLVEEILAEFIDTSISINKNSISFADNSVEKALKNQIFLFLLNYRDSYNTKRKNNWTKAKLKDFLYKRLFDYLPKKIDVSLFEEQIFVREQLKNSLTNFRNAICVYCFNRRQFDYLIDFFYLINQPTVVFVSFEIEERIIINDKLLILEFDLNLAQPFYKNTYLKRVFPQIYWFLNLFYEFFEILMPKCILVLEGCHPEMEALATLARSFNFPSICLQQGWPSVFHSRFRNMTYDAFLTWGAEFNMLWSKYNSKPKFIDMGYIYKVQDEMPKQNVITFFIQSPVIILDKNSFEEYLSLVTYCAESFPDYQIWLREHPEYKLDESFCIEFSKYRNIEFVSDLEISHVFQKSKINVSVFSSTIMEGVNHNVIPFVCNFSSFQYYPNYIRDQYLGVVVSNVEEAKTQLVQLVLDLNWQRQIYYHTKIKKQKLFSRSGNEAIKMILELPFFREELK